MALAEADIAAVLEKKNLLLELVRPLLEDTARLRLLKPEVNAEKVSKECYFIAYAGVTRDGHQYINQAIQQGARLVVCEVLPKDLDKKVWYLRVKNSREAWAILCRESYGCPDESLSLFGITGTNGKTSTAWYLWNLLQSSGRPSGMIGTIGVAIGNQLKSGSLTTPDPDQLFLLFKEMKDAGIKFCVMEVSSQSLLHHRVAGLRFSGIGFTSFSQDHLDLHGSMDAYLAAKLQIFQLHSTPSTVLAIHSRVIEIIQTKEKDFFERIEFSNLYVYGVNQSNLQESKRTIWVESQSNGNLLTLKLLGESISKRSASDSDFLNENLSCALLLMQNVGLSFSEIVNLPTPPQVPGRMECLARSDGAKVYIDYAHTPDALERALSSAESNCQGKLILVFGCGGDRDRAKRPLMGTVASHLADYVILTNDNPRSENPKDIINDILAGFDSTKDRLEVIFDRRKAIERAILMAEQDDTVLIAGKGHEGKQIIGKISLPFDDRKIAEEFLRTFTL